MTRRLAALCVAALLLASPAWAQSDADSTADAPAAPDTVAAMNDAPAADSAATDSAATDSAATGSATTDSAATDDRTVTVQVTGVKNTAGKLLVALYADADAFPNDDDEAVKRTATTIDGTPVTVTFNDVPAGTYAVAVIHDENDNTELDTNFFGVPKEGFGFSNGAEAGTFGPPDFDEAAIEVDGATTAPVTVSY